MSLFGVRCKLLFRVLVVVRIVDVACERKCGRGPRSTQLESRGCEEGRPIDRSAQEQPSISGRTHNRLILDRFASAA